MKALLSISLFFFAGILFGQSTVPYKTDTIVSLRQKVFTYCFDFDGGKQGFYWGDNNQLSYLSSFLFSVKNTFIDPITVERISQGNNVIEFSALKKLPCVIQPQDTLKLIAKVLTNEEHIDVPIEVFYSRKGVQHTLIIPTWQNRLRTYQLRIYNEGTDVTKQCQVYGEKNGTWQPLETNDSIPGYVFFLIRAEQDQSVRVRIRYDKPEMTEATIFTSRGGYGYIYHELQPSFQKSLPNTFLVAPGSPSTTQFCLITKKWDSVESFPQYFDSIQKILKKFTVSLDKETMVVTAPDQKTGSQLDQKLRSSGLEAKLLPLIHATDVLSDQFVVFFTPGTSREGLTTLFQQAGITEYYSLLPTETEKQVYGNAQKFGFRVNVIGTTYPNQLKLLWDSSSVKLLTHETFRNPFLPDLPD